MLNENSTQEPQLQPDIEHDIQEFLGLSDVALQIMVSLASAQLKPGHDNSIDNANGLIDSFAADVKESVLAYNDFLNDSCEESLEPVTPVAMAPR